MVIALNPTNAHFEPAPVGRLQREAFGLYLEAVKTCGRASTQGGRFRAWEVPQEKLAQLQAELAKRGFKVVQTVAQAKAQAAPSKVEEKAPVAKQKVSEGFWTLGERIFKVQKNLSGTSIYAKELIPPSSFEYAPGGVKLLQEGGTKLTQEQAAAYGKLYGVCCCCGRRLTDETSIALGIGPICAKKYF